MKTTIDIADDLISRARAVQRRDEVTLRALVEEGLRMVLERHARAPKFTYKPVVVGGPWEPGMPAPDINRIIAESNERESMRRAFGSDAIREANAPAGKARKRVATRKPKQ